MAHRLVAALALVALAAWGMSACDDDDMKASDVESSVRSALGSGGFDADQIADVSCPSGRSGEVGRSFECTARVAGVDVTITIDRDDDVKVATAVYETGAVEEKVETDYEENTGVAVSASCSHGPVIVVPIGSTFECTVEDRDGEIQTVTLTADTSGAYVLMGS
jgi:hypothetical protein